MEMNIESNAKMGKTEMQYPWGEKAKTEKVPLEIFEELEKAGYKLDLTPKDNIIINWK